jgi:hypothetical protein
VAFLSCLIFARADKSYSLTVGTSTQFHLTASERDQSPGHLVPFVFSNADGSSIENATIYVDFCSQCGSVVILGRTFAPPTSADFDFNYHLDGTGNSTAPQRLVIGPVTSSALAVGNRIYMGMDFEEPSCTFFLSVLNSSALSFHALTHGMSVLFFLPTHLT